MVGMFVYLSYIINIVYVEEPTTAVLFHFLFFTFHKKQPIHVAQSQDMSRA